MSKIQRVVYLTRVESFSAAHRLHCSKLSDEENVRIFGKCNNLAGHGHNYKVEVTVCGHPDRTTGMVMNISDLKVLIQAHVMEHLDHKNLDVDVDWFRTNSITSTAENICLYIFDQLVDKLPDKVRLHSVKLFETDKNVVQVIA